MRVGGTEKRGGEIKILKKQGKRDQGVGASKRWGWKPLKNYDNIYKLPQEGVKTHHLNLFAFTIGELHYYRLFEIGINVCSVISFSSHSYHTNTTNASQLTGFSTTQALTER